MKKVFSTALVASAIALVPTGALADPSLPNIRPHKHVLELPNGGLVQIGPDICENPELQQAFNQFHYNVHHSSTDTLGPQDGAPGLHDDKGAEIAAFGCSFTIP